VQRQALAEERVAIIKDKQKRDYDAQRRPHPFHVNQRVLLRVPRPRRCDLCVMLHHRLTFVSMRSSGKHEGVFTSEEGVL
jgi:hypothetical protein